MSAQALITDTKEIKELQEKLKSLKLYSSETTVRLWRERDILESIGVEIITQTEERFEFQADVSGKSWQDISQKTKEYYSKKGIGGSILSRTRQLRDTLESQVNGSEVLAGATKIYAATHNFGDESRNIPQREYLGLSSDNFKDIENIVNDFLEDSLKRVSD